MALAPFTYDPPTDPALRIVHRDEALLVVDKPSGLLSVPGATPYLADSLETRVVDLEPTARLIHRLDKDTSGLMVFALTATAQRHVGLQFEKRMVRKTYQARVWGHLAGTHGVVDLPLATDPDRRPAQRIDLTGGRTALTHWRVMAREAAHTRLELFPLTGRSHQLRVHMKALGHPILGDVIYAPPAAVASAPRLQLHAAELAIRHPLGGAWLQFLAPCPF